MKKTITWAKAALFILLSTSLSASCSDDNPSEVSRTIKEIEIWEKGDKHADLSTVVKLTYNEAGKLTQVSSDNADGDPLLNINYNYPDETSFRFNYSSEEENLGRIIGTLENGRVYSCKFANPTTSIAYLYTKDGYLLKSNGEDVTMEFYWDNGNLSSIKSTSRSYNTKFTPSSIPNNYSIDLNILPQLIEESSEYRRNMNTYCWLAGILGNRSFTIAEDENYIYHYGFDEKGRINKIELIHRIGSVDSAYSFQFTYEE